MLGMHGIDIFAGLSYIASGGLAAVAALLAVLFPGHAAIIALAGSVIVAVAGLVVRLKGNPTPTTNSSGVTNK